MPELKKKKSLVELVVPDIHNRFESVYARTAMLAKGVDRVFFVGDLRNQIDYHDLEDLVGPEEKKFFKEQNDLEKKLQKIIARYGTVDDFFHALQNGELKPDEFELYKKYAA